MSIIHRSRVTCYLKSQRSSLHGIGKNYCETINFYPKIRFYRNTILRPFSQSIKDNNTFKLQYISDIHIDTHKDVPKINPLSKYLAICGDVGQPYANRYKDFIHEQSNKFEKVFFVPGNHDFDLGPMYHKNRVEKWEPFIKNICQGFGNVFYLNCDTNQLDNDILIAGTILWSRPIPNVDSVYSENDPRISKYFNHIIEHSKHVDWISKTIEENKNKKIIMLTHFVPTFKLIEKKYKGKGPYSTSWFATDLEHLIKDPIKAWICGHTHSVMSCKVNGIQCAVNAYGYGQENKYNDNKNINKIIEI